MTTRSTTTTTTEPTPVGAARGEGDAGLLDEAAGLLRAEAMDYEELADAAAGDGHAEYAATMRDRASKAHEKVARLRALAERLPALERDAARWDRLEAMLWSGSVGNGLALFPFTRLPQGTRHISLMNLGDEDGSNLGEGICEGSTLREALDRASAGATPTHGETTGDTSDE